MTMHSTDQDWSSDWETNSSSLPASYSPLYPPETHSEAFGVERLGSR